jgi:small subunit ribosomal protein S19e
MANVYETKASTVIEAAAQALKGKVKKPAYVDFVKSSMGRERAPASPDFWYVRCASILRKVYLNGPIGVSRLRTWYGNKKEHVIHKKHYVKAGGSIIRDALIELEKLNYVKTTKEGRVITPQGKSFLDKICGAKPAGGA